MSVVDEHLRLDDCRGRVSERNRRGAACVEFETGMTGYVLHAVCISRVIGVLAVSFSVWHADAIYHWRGQPSSLVRVSTSTATAKYTRRHEPEMVDALTKNVARREAQ